MESKETTAGSPAPETAPPAEPSLEAQIKEQEAKYLYLYAEFENFKKRSLKERSDLLKFGWENALRDFLQVADNLDRALGHAPASTDANWLAGIKMVQTQLQGALTKQGVQPIAALGVPFDANLHEAVGQTPHHEPAGTPVHEELRGYTLHGRLLRAARVIVSQGVSPGNPGT